jgi:hypothetical protein
MSTRMSEDAKTEPRSEIVQAYKLTAQITHEYLRASEK